MLKLEYSRKLDKFQTVTVIGSPAGIWDLYWQLTHNYSDTPDGTGIGRIKVTNLDGGEVQNRALANYFSCSTELDKNLDS